MRQHSVTQDLQAMSRQSHDNFKHKERKNRQYYALHLQQD